MPDHDDVQKMQVLMAELRTDIRHLSHEVKNLSAKLEVAPSPKELLALEARVKNLESNLNKAAWAIITAWIGGLGVVVSMVLDIVKK